MSSYYKFKKNDIFYNRIKTHPQVELLIFNGTASYNGQQQSGSNSNTPNGYINLYEINVNRGLDGAGPAVSSSLARPYIVKGGSLHSFKTIETAPPSSDGMVFNTDYDYGDKIFGSYPMTASITKVFYPEYDASSGQAQIATDTDLAQPVSASAVLATYKRPKRRIEALKNTLNFYKKYSEHYAYSSSYGEKSKQALGLISVPSIYYGSRIQSGSVSLQYYVSGTLVGELRDSKGNGELIEVNGAIEANKNKVAGVVLYNEGFLILTGSWDLYSGNKHKEDYGHGGLTTAKWMYFAQHL